MCKVSINSETYKYVFWKNFQISNTWLILTGYVPFLVCIWSSVLKIEVLSWAGDQIHVVCTGTVVKNDGYGTSILTAATLVRSFNIDNGFKIIPTLRVGCAISYVFHLLPI
jgi:hypothetical protein